jgi:hypothetical protein
VLASTPAVVANPLVDRGDSDFDVRHSFTGAVSYDLPSPSMAKIPRFILSNWSIDDFIMVRSSLPVDIVASTSVFSGTAYTSRPDAVAGQPLYLSDAECASVFEQLGALGQGQSCPGGRGFNPAAFAMPPSDRQGTLGRNVLRGFGAWQNDFTVRRQFVLGEKLRVQVRAEFFNIFNHPNFGPPTNTLSSPLFGLTTQTLASSLGGGGGSGGLNPLYQIGGPRSIQFAIKLKF